MDLVHAQNIQKNEHFLPPYTSTRKRKGISQINRLKKTLKRKNDFCSQFMTLNHDLRFIFE